MASITTLFTQARVTLLAVNELTADDAPASCTSAEVARWLHIPTRDAAARLGRLEDMGLARPVPQAGYSRGPAYRRRWKLTDDGREALAEITRGRS